MRCGAPDLPFIETVAWSLKQVGAAFVVIGSSSAVVIALIYAHAALKDWLGRRK